MAKKKKIQSAPPKKGKLKKKRTFKFRKFLLFCLLVFLMVHYRSQLSAIILDSLPGQFSQDSTQTKNTTARQKTG